MKVLHLSSEKGFRGGERQLAYLIGELALLGIESVAVVKKGSEFEKYCQKQNVKCHLASFANALDVGSALKVKKICAAECIDIIHIHASKAHSVAVLAGVLGNRIPMVLSRKVNFALKKSFVTRWKYNYSGIKKIIGVSQAVTDRMRNFIENPDKCVTVYDGIDLTRFDKCFGRGNVLRETYSIEKTTKMVGNTTALSESKDLQTFINTIEILRQEHLPIHGFIIGDGECRQELEAIVKEKGLENAITFTGFQNPVEPYLVALDAFLITSKQEGLGSSILDAFVAGVPVVATRAGGMPELVIHEQTGLLAEVGDSRGLAANIRRLFSDASFCDKVKSNALQFVKKFSKENNARLTAAIYQNVLTTL